MACNVTLQITRGATFRLVMTAKDSEGTVVPLTGYSVAMQVRRSAGGTLIVDLAPEITDAGAGEVTVELTATETAAIGYTGTFHGDVQFTTPDSDVLYTERYQVVIHDPITE